MVYVLRDCEPSEIYISMSSTPPWVSEVSTSKEGDWWNMCIPNRFTVPTGIPVAFMLPRELSYFYINVTLFRLIYLFMLIFFTYFCLGISEEDALLVKYQSCTICICLRNTAKHDMCSGQKSDIV